MGRFDEASREFQMARELDPVSLGLIRSIAEHFRYLRQYDKAIAENQKVLEMDPGFENALESLSFAYANNGMYEESTKVIEQLAITEGEDSLAKTMKTAYARGGYKDALKGRLQFYRDRRRAGSFVAFWDEALLQVQLGNKDLALEALEKAYDEREDVTDLAVNPSWDSIRADPRFQDLVRRIGLPVNAVAGAIPH
jgi:tetratricopeptide (TPR) repeat protein